jgi:hypothetical protein
MEFARQHSYFKEEEIVEFQYLADAFFELWIELEYLD